LLFSGIFLLLSFKVHYHTPIICFFLVFLGLCIVLSACLVAYNDLHKKMHHDPTRMPTWSIFLALTLALAWFMGVSAGMANYEEYSRNYYDLENMHSYTGVDPSVKRGEQMMDASTVWFEDGTKLDISRSMAFMNTDLYCVAPITFGTGVMTHYDFWAVGTNCCSGSAADFHCENARDPSSNSALRLMVDSDRALYRLAVQQAEAFYLIQAQHPLFFTWERNATTAKQDIIEEGVKWYMVGMITYFFLQAFLVACATLAFAKLGHY
jgi:hypothetical protein